MGHLHWMDDNQLPKQATGGFQQWEEEKVSMAITEGYNDNLSSHIDLHTDASSKYNYETLTFFV